MSAMSIGGKFGINAEFDVIIVIFRISSATLFPPVVAFIFKIV